jgi:hypothetical protein
MVCKWLKKEVENRLSVEKHGRAREIALTWRLAGIQLPS